MSPSVTIVDRCHRGVLVVVGMAPQQNENTTPELESTDERNPRVTFVIAQSDFDQLDRVATVRRSSVAALVREIVGAALDAGFASA